MLDTASDEQVWMSGTDTKGKETSDLFNISILKYIGCNFIFKKISCDLGVQYISYTATERCIVQQTAMYTLNTEKHCWSQIH